MALAAEEGEVEGEGEEKGGGGVASADRTVGRMGRRRLSSSQQNGGES